MDNSKDNVSTETRQCIRSTWRAPGKWLELRVLKSRVKVERDEMRERLLGRLLQYRRTTRVLDVTAMISLQQDTGDKMGSDTRSR
jgi:hypothetical protein